MTVTVEIEIPAPAANPPFIVGSSLVGDKLTSSEYVYTDVKPASGRVDFSSGGSTSALNKLDVGMLSLTTQSLDPSVFQPGRGVRVREPTTAEPITNRLTADTAAVTSVYDDPTQPLHVHPRLPQNELTVSETADEFTVAVSDVPDPVIGVRVPSLVEIEDLHNLPGNPNATVTITATTKATNATTVTATADGGFTPTVPAGTVAANATGNSSATGKSGEGPAEVKFTVSAAAGAPVTGLLVTLTMTYSAGGVPRVLWTGSVKDITAAHDRDGDVTSTVEAADPMALVANTPVPTITSDAAGETFLSRANQLAALSPVALRVTDSYRVNSDQLGAEPGTWVHQNSGAVDPNLTRTIVGHSATADGDLYGIEYRSTRTGTATITPQNHGIQTTAQNLTPGTEYRVTARARLGDNLNSLSGDIADVYALGVVGVGFSPNYRLPRGSAKTTVALSYTFTATATSHQIVFSCSENVTRSGGGSTAMEHYRIGDVYLTDTSADPYRLRSNALGASLKEQLDVLCDSTGSLWRVTRTGVVDLRRFIEPRVKAEFTDVPGGKSYTSLVLAYGTANVVNALNVANAGVDAEGNATDDPYVYTDQASVDIWGPRSESLTVNLLDAAMVQARSLSALAESPTPEMRPQSLTYVYSSAGYIGVHDAVRVTRGAVTWECLVVGVEHNLNPYIGKPNGTQHTATLTLRSV